MVYYFGKSIYRQSRAFWTKKILVPTLNTMGGILGGDMISEQSKIWKYPVISYWLACITGII